MRRFLCCSKKSGACAKRDIMSRFAQYAIDASRIKDFSPAAAWKKLFLLFAFAASPQKQTYWNGFSACGSLECSFFFIRSGGVAARTNERNVHFHPAGGEKPWHGARPTPTEEGI
jgi:hypothetical protein